MLLVKNRRHTGTGPSSLCRILAATRDAAAMWRDKAVSGCKHDAVNRGLQGAGKHYGMHAACAMQCGQGGPTIELIARHR
jgi:hypothetical protein